MAGSHPAERTCPGQTPVPGRGNAAERILVDVDEPETGWRPGDHILVDLPDGQTVRCRIVSIKDDGTIQVVPEHAIVIR